MQRDCQLRYTIGMGTKGFYFKTVRKYYMAAEYCSILLKEIKDMLDLKKFSFQHTDLQSTRITRDEADVKSLLAMLQSH